MAGQFIGSPTCPESTEMTKRPVLSTQTTAGSLYLFFIASCNAAYTDSHGTDKDDAVEVIEMLLYEPMAGCDGNTAFAFVFGINKGIRQLSL